MKKKLLLLFLFFFFFLTPLFNFALAQSATSCFQTAVGNPSGPTPTFPPECTSSGGSFDGKFQYYCQGDPKWANTCDLGDAGCGPTSLAMVMSTFGIQTTPPDVDSVFQQSGWRLSCPAGSDIHAAIHSSWFLNQGFTVPDVDLQDGSGEGGWTGKLILSEMKKYLDEGYLIIVNGHDYPCKGCYDNNGNHTFQPVGHYFVVDEVDVANQKIHTRDPNSCSYATGEENSSLAWTDLLGPRSSGGGAESTYNAWPIKK